MYALSEQLKTISTVTQLLEVYRNILDLVSGEREVDVIHLDLSKAFDMVSHNLLLYKLHQFGISGQLLMWFKSYLTDRHQRVVLNSATCDWLPVTSGVPQGSLLGPLLFLFYINDMPDSLENGSDIALFADNINVYRPIDSSSSGCLLQQDLTRLQEWSSNWKMAFNAEKCKVICISRKRSSTSALSRYQLDHQELECVFYTSDLGITVSHNLQWTKHIEAIVSKANKTLGLVKCLCGRDLNDINIRKRLYYSLVRPKLEYCSNVWSPYTT